MKPLRGSFSTALNCFQVQQISLFLTRTALDFTVDSCCLQVANNYDNEDVPFMSNLWPCSADRVMDIDVEMIYFTGPYLTRSQSKLKWLSCGFLGVFHHVIMSSLKMTHFFMPLLWEPKGCVIALLRYLMHWLKWLTFSHLCGWFHLGSSNGCNKKTKL